MEKYYKIEKEKNNELEKLFKTFKSKIKYSNINYLNKGKFWAFSNGSFIILDKITFNKIHEIKFNNNEEINSVIELDNNDLVIMINNDNILYFYRLEKGKYILFQKMKEDITGYRTQLSFSGCMTFPKTFKLNEIKKLYGNKFISISNYGIRIYDLNEKEEYSIVLMDVHSEGIEHIYKIDKQKFIFCSSEFIGPSLGGGEYNIITIEKVELKNITDKEKISKIEELKKKYKWFFFEKGEERDISKSEKMISSLKLTSYYEKFFEYSTYEECHRLSDFFVLKGKYFIIMIDYNILIFDLSTGKQMIRYKIVMEGKNNLYYNNYEVGKWNNINDNEFILNINGNITLFELNDSKEIDLKIIGYSFFPNIKNLKKIEDENIFYSNKKEYILIY